MIQAIEDLLEERETMLFRGIKSKHRGFPGGSEAKKSACHAGDPGSIPGSGRSLEAGNSNPLQYSCLENTMDRGAWQSMGLQESDTTSQLNHHHTWQATVATY